MAAKLLAKIAQICHIWHVHSAQRGKIIWDKQTARSCGDRGDLSTKKIKKKSGANTTSIPREQ